VSARAALALGIALLPAAALAADPPASAPSPAASAAATVSGKPLRHLVFSVAVDLNTQTDTRTIDVAANRGGNTEHYIASGSSHGTIVCDIVGVASGDLLVDVSEDAGERSAAKVRVAVQGNGAGLVFLPNQGTLTEEETEIVALLSPGLMGGERAVGDSWTFKQTAPNYTTVKTLRLGAIKDANQISLALEENYTRTGADGLTGTTLGTFDYDPSRLVPLDAKLDKTTRQEDNTGYKTRKVGMTFTLTEDSLAKH
jgi:hypothetical protein